MKMIDRTIAAPCGAGGDASPPAGEPLRRRAGTGPPWAWLLLLCLATPALAETVVFHQSSTPVNVVEDTSQPETGTPVSTVTAPEFGGGNLHFAYWTLNGIRQSGPGGVARNPVTFTITAASEAVAHYAPNVEFQQAADPVSVIAQTTFPVQGTVVSTQAAPDRAFGYHFTHWTIQGVRANDPSGGSINPAVFTIAGATEAIANYVPEGQDSDADGLPDWWEIRYLGDVSPPAAGDADGDGFTNAQEFTSASHPGMANNRAQGGVSRRRGTLLNVDVGVGDPTWSYGGISRRRSATTLVVQNTAQYAVLRQISTPPGVLSTEQVVEKGSIVTLAVAPETSGDYHFTGWLVDGMRYQDATRRQPFTLTVTADTKVLARYTREGDADADGIPDWQEWFLFDSLQYNRTSDPEGDGLNFAVEETRGYSQVAKNELSMGGVSRRRSVTATVDTTGRLIYRVVSAPASILNDAQYIVPGTPITVPDQRGVTVGGYLFSWWDLNGVRQADPSGVAVSTFRFNMNIASTATAHFVKPDVDTDGDGIKDWNEMTYYGTLARGPGDDTDADGFDYGTELFRGSSPRVVDFLSQGGVSRRRSALTPVNAVFLPNPPAIGPGAATEITTHSARLNTLLNPIGADTTMHFEYGLTDAYGQATPPQSIGSGLQALNVTAPITGLEADTLYHFRVVATNGEGTSTGGDVVFRTLIPTYADWATLLGIGSPDQDFDWDGLDNLLEFAFGLNPKQASDRSQLDEFAKIELMDGRFRLTCSQPPGAGGLIYGAEYSTDMSTWLPLTDTGSGLSHEFWVPEQMATEARQFVRWTIISP